MRARKVTLETIVEGVLAPLGFVPQGEAYWYRTHGGLIEAVNVQKSKYSSVRYINLGICLASLLNTKKPTTRDFHVTTRIQHFVEKRSISDGLTLSELPASFNEEETGQIAALIKEGVETFFQYSRSQSILKQSLIDGAFERRGLASLALREKL